MATWCFSGRICLSKVTLLRVRKPLNLVRKQGREPPRFSSNGEKSRFQVKALAKTTLVCWSVGGLSCCGKCEGVSSGGASIKVDLHINKSGHAGGFLHCIMLAFSLTIRACVLLLKFGPLLWLYPVTHLSSSFASLWFHLLLKMTESSGPTYIKLGQWASTRRDLFSEEFCIKFSKLHIKVPPHPWDYTKSSLRKAFGEEWEKIFKFESKEPIGSGCVAQVYKAYADISALGDPVLKELSKNSVLDSALEAWQVSGFKGLFRWLWKRKPEELSEKNGDHRLLHENSFHEDINKNFSSVEQIFTSTPVFSPKRDHFVPVAIKVLHPGLEHQVQTDLFLMKMGSRFAGLFPGIKWLSLTEILEEFEKLMLQQIDLRFEAKNLERFRLNFQEVDYVKFPIPLHPFVTRNILVETFEESEPISHYLHTETTTDVRQKLAKMGMDMLLKMVFVDNFVHADLHPGNILVQGVKHFKDCVQDRATIVDLCDMLVLEMHPSRPPCQLVLLDAGIIAELQSADLENFRAVFRAVVLGQGERVAELILHHARANQCKDVERFKADMAELVANARSNTVALGKVQVAKLLSSVFNLLMTHQVKLESNFASVVFAIMVLEGLGRSLDPEVDILKAAKPLLV